MPDGREAKWTSWSSAGHAFVLAAALLLVLVSASPLVAQALPAHDYAWVKNFVRVSVPELAGNRHLMEVTFTSEFDNDDSSSLVTGVNVRERGPQGKTVLLARLASPSHDRVSFEFPQDPESKVLNSLTEEAAAHSEWTEQNLVAALHRAKAEYPFDRKDAFQAHLDVYRFAPVLGAIQKVEVDFVWRRPEAPHIVVIAWRVRLEAVGVDGRVAHYILAFEPMRGRLTSLTRLAEEE